MATISTPQQELERFADLVERMRRAQISYFKERKASILFDAKNLEKLVDLDLARYKSGKWIP
jgi:hypothetical protein